MTEKKPTTRKAPVKKAEPEKRPIPLIATASEILLSSGYWHKLVEVYDIESGVLHARVKDTMGRTYEMGVNITQIVAWKV